MGQNMDVYIYGYVCFYKYINLVYLFLDLLINHWHVFPHRNAFKVRRLPVITPYLQGKNQGVTHSCW